MQSGAVANTKKIDLYDVSRFRGLRNSYAYSFASASEARIPGNWDRKVCASDLCVLASRFELQLPAISFSGHFDVRFSDVYGYSYVSDLLALHKE